MMSKLRGLSRRTLSGLQPSSAHIHQLLQPSNSTSIGQQALAKYRQAQSGKYDVEPWRPSSTHSDIHDLVEVLTSTIEVLDVCVHLQQHAYVVSQLDFFRVEYVNGYSQSKWARTHNKVIAKAPSRIASKHTTRAQVFPQRGTRRLDALSRTRRQEESIKASLHTPTEGADKRL
jgi:hypothetical protein